MRIFKKNACGLHNSDRNLRNNFIEIVQMYINKHILTNKNLCHKEEILI